MSSNVSSLLKEWNDIKNHLKHLQHQDEHYRQEVQHIMNERNTNILKSRDFMCKRSTRSRESMSKNHVPRQIWNEYAIQTEYNVLSLTERHGS